MKQLLALTLCLLLLSFPVIAAQQTATITITVTIVGPLQVTAVSPIPGIVVGQAYTASWVNVSGGTPPYTYAVDSTTPLPTGLTMNAGTGVVSGTVASLPSSCTSGSPCNMSFKVNIADSTK